MSPRDRSHAQFRELISARLDGRLPRHVERRLVTHVRSCAACRSVQNDYIEQRRLLRAMAALPPPRDLWARTSAGLDREMLRHGPASLGGDRTARLPGAAIVGSAGALAVALMLASAQLGPSPTRPDATARGDEPTPITIAPQSIVLVGSSSRGLVFYRTDLEEVCPTSAPRCTEQQSSQPQLIRLPANARPASLSISPDGELIAITAQQSGTQGVFVLRHDAPASVAPEASDDLAPPVRTALPSEGTPGLATATPGLRSGASPRGTSGAAASDPVSLSTDNPTSPEPGSPPTAPITSPPAPTASPTITAPSSSANPPRDTPVPSGTRAPGEGVPGTPLATDPSLLELATVAVLEDVLTTGAPAAWSVDGSLLAFSAMPSDASRGPDVYVWRSGEKAERLTDDHASYFASWADGRIVVSRIVEASSGDDLAVRTVLIDPETGAEEVLDGLDLWLPAVSPVSGHAVGWHGELDLAGGVAVPRTGGLYVAKWLPRSYSPRGDDPELEPDPSKTHDASPSRPEERDVPRSQGGGASPSASTVPETADPAATPEADGEGEDGEPSVPPIDAHESAQPSEAPDGDSEPRNPRAPEPQESPSAEPSARPDAHGGLMALEPERDVAERPVTDWLVKWSPDGSALGFWVADSAGASWGELAVLTFNAESGAPNQHQPLLAPTLARRTFTLDNTRVVWVAPAEGGVEGEVRLIVWGEDGEGGLTLPSLDLREVVPAF